MRSSKILIPRAQHLTTISSSRSRSVQACDLCRKRKAKCNRAKPCLYCEGLGLECTYTEVKRPREVDQLRSRINRLERVIKPILSRANPTSSVVLAERPDAPSSLLRQNSPGNLYSALGQVDHELSDLHHIYQAIQECDVDILPEVVNTIRYSASVHDAATRLGRQLPSHQAPMTLERMQQVWLTRMSGQVETIEQQPPYSVLTTNLWSTLVSDATASHLFPLYFAWDNPTWRHFSYDLEKPWDRRKEIGTAKQLFRVIEKLWAREKTRICIPTKGQGLHTSSARVLRDNPQAHKAIACAVYDMELMSVQILKMPSVWPGPPEVFLDEDEAFAADLNEQWTPYPFTIPVYRPYTNTRSWARRNLLIIVNDMVKLSFTLGNLTDLDDWQRGTACYTRFDTFKQAPPAVLDVETNKSPHNICLHLYYHATVVNLCGPFISRRSNISKKSLAAFTNFDPRKILGETMDSMGALVLIYRACHGWKSVPVAMSHYFFMAGIHAASHLELSRWREILVTCVAGLWHMSLTWRLSRAFLRTIELVLNSSADATYIPKQVQSILREHHEKVWTRVEVDGLGANYVVHHYLNLELEAGSGNGPFHGESLETVIRAFDRLGTDYSESDVTLALSTFILVDVYPYAKGQPYLAKHTIDGRN
ncbi:hypothetical protein BO94DRAFT_625925 [Aspergillus sclerotioniger CBS 115572]|uniref:Zn(2)-C6 fungal-type domain-containing protein n=1 Tax=Aspergillus sclerotioniger CBS 115572 TaxID=1450535 RepID=A0A317W2H9_9EURO|nr:hypothetical protein BO94DRAFT_625925 [Aspergillus sclerotioniger CBS 115572]PWY80784.1 hypothetical protein BO94DRAFT_625925 [Aspergillus sclerotioniger CBS 115572]